MESGRPPGESAAGHGSGMPEPRRNPVRLRVQLGPNIGQVYAMSGDTLTVGRAKGNDVVLDDPQVSRFHARLYWQGEDLLVEDLGSTNGTLVNERRTSGVHALQPTETIAIGGTVFSVEGFSAPITLGIQPVGGQEAQTLAGVKQVPGPRRAPASSPAGARSGGMAPWLIVGGIFGVLAIVGIIVLAIYLMTNQPGGEPLDTIPDVVIRSPVTGSRVAVDDPVSVTGTASDAAGITKVELLVNGEVVGEQPDESGQSPASFAINLSWTPSAEGTYTLEVRAQNSQGRTSAPTTVMVQVVDTRPATQTPQLVTETSEIPDNLGPIAVTTADLNVREGPGQNYPVLGLLAVGLEVKVTGKNADGSWWRVEYPPASGRNGWIYAPFTRSENVGDVVVVETPVPPTLTPTPTLIPSPTSTAAPVPSASPSATSLPTATPTEENALVVELTANSTSIEPGGCVVLEWRIENVIAAFLDGGEFSNMGVTGPVGSKETCLNSTTRFVLRAETEQGTRESTVTISVGNEDQVISILPNEVKGMVRQDGKVLAQPISGDDLTNQSIRAFVAFDISSLRDKQIIEAHLDLSDYRITGNPSDLGAIFVEEVEWVPVLDSTDYSTPVRSKLAEIRNADELEDEFDVTALLRGRLAGDSKVLPVRFRFEVESNDNAQDDYIDWDNARLVVRYR